MFEGFLVIQECIMTLYGDKFLNFGTFLLYCKNLSGQDWISSEIKHIQVGNSTCVTADN